MRSLYRFLFSLLAVIYSAVALCAQVKEEKKADSDSLVRLLSASSVEVSSGTQEIRKVIGPATFLHNGTYLKCDTALWYVDREYIDAIGNVSIIQENTVLTSETMHYRIKDDLAQFRGVLVELKDKDKNTLRTKHLDYNTKDSVAVFRTGGSMMDKDGNIIESVNGDYDGKTSIFRFKNNVNMFTDTVFIRTYWLDYFADDDKAEFGGGVNAWKDDNMLSSDSGWYDTENDIFHFRKRVHILTDTQEGWSDTLFFYRNTSYLDMLGNVQVTDGERGASALADRLEFVNSPREVRLSRDPALVVESNQDGKKDTLYLRADTIIYNSLRKCDIDSLDVVTAESRRTSLEVDVIDNMRKKNREEAEKKRRQEQQQQKRPGQQTQQSKPAKPAADSVAPSADSLAASADSLAAASDSLAAVADSLAAIVPPDTTEIAFVTALHNVRAFKPDLQAVCDSLLYSDLDSLVRMFINPVIWSEVKNQLSSDSVFMVVNDNRLQKVSFQGNAFIHTQEDTVHYNQVKGTEMMAYFNADSELYRFDAMGGSSAVFYLREKDEISLVNQKESKLLSANLKDGNISKIYYYENVKDDVHPIDKITIQQQRLKGFGWQGERRPQSSEDITTREIRKSERKRYENIKHPSFRYTGIFFPGYIDGINREIFVRDSLKADALAKKQARERFLADSLARVKADSLELLRLDSLAVADSLKHVQDSIALAAKAATDSLKAALDSVVTDIDSMSVDGLSKKELKALSRDLDTDMLSALVTKLESRYDGVMEKLRQRPKLRDGRKELRREKRYLRKALGTVEKVYRKKQRKG